MIEQQSNDPEWEKVTDVIANRVVGKIGAEAYQEILEAVMVFGSAMIDRGQKMIQDHMMQWSSRVKQDSETLNKQS